MTKKNTKNFDLSQIAKSGQCFRMSDKGGGVFSIIAKDKYLKAEQKGNVCRFSCSDEEFDSFWMNYFDLATDYSQFKNKVDPKDDYLCGAADFGGGIRILRQDLWETTVSFLISQQNNIVRIKRCIENICAKYGEKKTAGDGAEYYGFPAPETLAELKEDGLIECNLGYRSRYVVRSAKMIASGVFPLEALFAMPYKEAKEELLRLPGVGAKVADCICLFALHHLQAFPVDTHIRQALDLHYPCGFPYAGYEGFQGVLQQYIFYSELHGDR